MFTFKRPDRFCRQTKFNVTDQLPRGTLLLLHVCLLVNMTIASAADRAAVDIISFVRGFHEYKDIWHQSVGEILDLKREPTNAKDML